MSGGVPDMIFDGKAEIWRDGGLSPLKLRNRTMRSATWEGLADEQGRMTDTLAEVLISLARGGVGLITFSHTMVHPLGQASVRMLAIYNDEQAESMKKAIDGIHAAGSLCSVQLNHGGRFSLVDDRIGPSNPELMAITGVPLRPCREMTIADIDEVVEAFRSGAVRAKKVGFDCVTIHAAHGYLLSEFLSPLFNVRKDEYGGSLENRARILRRVVKVCREAVGPEIPILVKMNSEDFAENGLTVKESTTVATWLVEDGVALIETSGGSIIGRYSGIRRGAEATSGYHAEAAAAWRRAIHAAKPDTHCLIALVGGLRSYDSCNKFIADGVCDIVSFSRPLIRDPDLIQHWQSDPHYVSQCSSCGGCHTLIKNNEGFGCLLRRAQEQKQAK